MVDRQTIGESASAGFGGITAAADGTFAWQRAFQVGCEYPERVARRGSLRRYGKAFDKRTAPIAVRYAAPVIPESPASENCDEGSY